MQRRSRLLLVLVACYQSVAAASARWLDDLLHKWHALLGSGPPRGHSQTCMRIGVTSRPSWLHTGLWQTCSFRKDMLCQGYAPNLVAAFLMASCVPAHSQFELHIHNMAAFFRAVLESPCWVYLAGGHIQWPTLGEYKVVGIHALDLGGHAVK